MENIASQISKMPLANYEKAYQYIIGLDYSDKEGIMFLEEQLYNLLQQDAENANLLALLMHEQIMNNKGQRARSIAYKIWEDGGVLVPEIERIYIDDLMNLYLIDMAGAALMPIISDLENNIAQWSNLLIKYAIISGNMALLERILSYLPDNNTYNILRDWCIFCEYLQATEHMPNIMERICKDVQDTILSFSFNLFFDREFPEIEFVFYVSDEVRHKDDMRENMNLQISSYCSAKKIEDLINLSSSVLSIDRHPRMDTSIF